MKKPISATKLRSNIYRILDEVLRTGTPREVKRGRQSLLILPKGPPRFRLRDLPRRKALNCSPEEIIRTTWEGEWRPDI